MATGSIVDALKSQGKDSSYAARKKMAEAAGIKNYTGTAAQNTALLKTVQPTKTTVAPVKTATVTPVKNVLNELSSTTTDPAIQKYKDKFAAAEAIGDTAGMVAAAKAADTIRVKQGGSAQNTALISRLSKLVTVPELEINEAIDTRNDLVLDFDKYFTPSQTEEQFYKSTMDKVNAALKSVENMGMASIQKSIGDIKTEGTIAQRGLEDVYRAQMEELASQADKIRAAYATSKQNIETTKAETLPTYDTAMNQQDILAQRQAKQIEGGFAQKGLGAGGQVTSELGQNAQTNLTEIGKIAGQKQNFIRGTANTLTDLERQQAVSLSDIERMKGTALQTMSSGQRNVIEKTTNALQGLTIDEKTLMGNLASQRLEIELGLSEEYRNMTQQERDSAFQKVLAQAGLQGENTQIIMDLTKMINDSQTILKEQQFQEKQFNVNQANWQREMSYKERQAEIDNAYSSGQLSVSQAQQALQQAKFDADQDPDSIDNKYKQAQIDALSGKINTNTSATVDDYAAQVNQMFLANNPSWMGGGTTFDKAGALKYIQNLETAGVQEQMIDSLLTRFGFPLGK
jgi:hypothetical protein